MNITATDATTAMSSPVLEMAIHPLHSIRWTTLSLPASHSLTASTLTAGTGTQIVASNLTVFATTR